MANNPARNRFLVHSPLVVTAAAEAIAAMFITGFGFVKGKDIRHMVWLLSSILIDQVDKYVESIAY